MSLRMRAWRALPVVAMAAAGVALAACGHEPPKPPAVPAKAPRTVHVGVVESSTGGARSLPATVFARQSATLAARISAAVIELPKREGEAVARGAVLVRLDDAALRAGVAAAEANAKAARTDLARIPGLAGRGAATPRELDEATARAAAAEAQLSAARDNLAYAVLRAPFAGALAARRVEVGDVVSPGQPLVVLEGQGGLEVRATASAEEVAGLKPGSEIPAQVDGQAKPLPARVTALSPAGDPATHRFELRADLPGADGLRSGLFARLEVPGASGAVLTVPAAAVFARGGLTGVLVVDTGVARLRWIAVGERSGDRIEARAGLARGEKVVLEPQGLDDGDPIEEAR